MNKKAILYYAYDPMCSWCWGYNPTWLELRNRLLDHVNIEYRVGGLAPDSDQPMAEQMQLFLQQTWQKIAQQLGTQFNFSFWKVCIPRRSTYPACRAVIIARDAGIEQEMYLAIQEAYYLHAKNPSDNSTLTTLAAGLGLNTDLFENELNSQQRHQQLLNEIEEVRKMPIQGFPSLVLAVNNEYIAIPIDYKNAKKTYALIKGYL